MLSRTVALPVIVGAALLKGTRFRKRALPPDQRTAFAAGTAASFASTLASQALIRVVERDSALWPYAAYRAGLAGVVLARLLRRKRKQRAELRGFGQPDAVVSGDGRPASGNGAPTWVSTGSGTTPSREESP
jgi:hypothetical protein